MFATAPNSVSPSNPFNEILFDLKAAADARIELEPLSHAAMTYDRLIAQKLNSLSQFPRNRPEDLNHPLSIEQCLLIAEIRLLLKGIYAWMPMPFLPNLNTLVRDVLRDERAAGGLDVERIQRLSINHGDDRHWDLVYGAEMEFVGKLFDFKVGEWKVGSPPFSLFFWAPLMGAAWGREGKVFADVFCIGIDVRTRKGVCEIF